MSPYFVRATATRAPLSCFAPIAVGRRAPILSKPCSGARRFVTFPAEDGPADFWLEWDLIAFAAVVADYLESFGRRSVDRFTGILF